MGKNKRGYRYKLFMESIWAMGYRSYDDYLRSDDWKVSKQWYTESGLPCKCLVCGDSRATLHHWMYEPVHDFRPWQLIPLCEDHHIEIHKHYNIGDRNIKAILGRAFPGLDASVSMQPFFQLRKRLLKTEKAKSKKMRKQEHNAKSKKNKVRAAKLSTNNRPCVSNVKQKKKKRRIKTAWEKHTERMGGHDNGKKKTFEEIIASNKAYAKRMAESSIAVS